MRKMKMIKNQVITLNSKNRLLPSQPLIIQRTWNTKGKKVAPLLVKEVGSFVVTPSHISMNAATLSSNATNVSVTNTAKRSLAISTIDAGSFWTDSDTCAGATLEENSSCSFTVQSYEPGNDSNTTTVTHGVLSQLIPITAIHQPCRYLLP